MRKATLKRFIVFSTILLACYFVWFFLSAGKPSLPDASPYRSLLYKVVFYILPLIILGDFIYLLSSFIRNAKTTIVLSLLLGLWGPLLLIYSVHTSPDPMAGMALIALVIFYAVASFITFLLIALIQLIIHYIQKRRKTG
ncbi:hypothetical protein [Candidatus Berkiella aquae]|uniref:Uncharacterized protein n=1 Tax=Candidatus Berkiella aquae TaxID=295108 RepID=A0A0Q9YEL2_9GAMM|nr:hypothetical protein [Candidatus Berkiella aquae]MCS5711632.1 hypothetical protein [Candidatus Berkiella aquae]